MRITEPEKPSLDLLNRRLVSVEKRLIEMEKRQEEILVNQKEILRRLPKTFIPPDCEYL